MSGHAVAAAGRAMDRSATQVRQRMSEGLSSLQTIAAVAPLIGVLATLHGIVFAFGVGKGEKTTLLAIMNYRLSAALAPAALSIAVAAIAWCAHRWMAGSLDALAGEIQAARLKTLNQLDRLPQVAIAAAPAARHFVLQDANGDDFGPSPKHARWPLYLSAFCLAAAWWVKINHYDSYYAFEQSSLEFWAMAAVAIRVGLSLIILRPLFRKWPARLLTASTLTFVWIAAEWWYGTHVF